MNAVPCHRFTGRPRPPKDKRDEVYIDMLSVEICLKCTLPECPGGKAANGNGYTGPPRCPYEEAVMERKAQHQAKQVVTLPSPRPDGAMREWECEVGR